MGGLIYGVTFKIWDKLPLQINVVIMTAPEDEVTIL
jgi:hypothetical protein